MGGIIGKGDEKSSSFGIGNGLCIDIMRMPRPLAAEKFGQLKP